MKHLKPDSIESCYNASKNHSLVIPQLFPSPIKMDRKYMSLKYRPASGLYVTRHGSNTKYNYLGPMDSDETHRN
jgi:hypothetical protein